jgi:hypothetical protein
VSLQEGVDKSNHPIQTPLLLVITINRDNIKIDLREIGWGGMDSVDLFQNRDQL